MPAPYSPGFQPAQHEQNTQPPFNPDRACLSESAVARIIDLSGVSNEAIVEFWNEQALLGQCKYFAHGLNFWPDEIVAEKNWGPAHRSVPQYIVRGHDGTGLAVYTWVRVSKAVEYGIIPAPLPEA